MSQDALYRNLLTLGAGIELCLEHKLQQSALVLLYSAIDTTAWLASDEPNVGKRFRDWVDRYLLQAKPLACTSDDLYAARCGLVHTFTPESRKSDHGEARQIAYADGTDKARKLQELTERVGMGNEHVVITIEDLRDAWRLGLGIFHSGMEKDAALAARVYAKAGKFFATNSAEEVDSALRAMDDV